MFGGFFANVQSGAGFDFGNALKFDGINDRVDFNPSGSMISYLDSGTLGFTLSFWVKIDPTQTGTFVVWSGDSLNTNICFIGETYIETRWGGNAGRNRFTFNYLDNLDTWLNVVAVKYPSTHSTLANNTRLWVNATELTRTITTTSTDGLTFRGLGKYDTTLNAGKFTIDEWYIVNAFQPTDLQITEYYNGGAGNPPLSTPDTHFKFDQDDGDTVLIDSGTDMINGLLENFTTPPAYFIPH